MLIGIDVAKAELVVAVRPSGERWTVANDERGVRTLVERFRRDAPELRVLEARMVRTHQRWSADHISEALIPA